MLTKPSLLLKVFLVALSSCLCIESLFAQNYQLFFKAGTREPAANFSELSRRGELSPSSLFKGQYHVLLQFEKLPSDKARAQMQSEGIKLLDYIPNNAYYAQIKAPINWTLLLKYNVRAITNLSLEEKTSEAFRTRPFAAWATAAKENFVDLRVELWGDYKRADIEADVLSLGGRFMRNEPIYRTIEFRVPVAQADKVVDFAWAQYVDITSRPKSQVNFLERGNHRSAAIFSTATYGLTGLGVRIGEWDGGTVDTHLDFTSRLFIKESLDPSAHPTHVGGTAAGAGLLNPLRMGMAPKSTLYSWNFDGDTNAEMTNAMANPSDRFEITTNSWGVGFSCPNSGIYDSDARFVDQFCNDFTFMSAQWAVANSQGSSCVAGGFRSISDGWVSSKNGIGVGALTSTDAMTSFSSFGPVQDGRIKPDICGIGQNVNSALPGNAYGNMSGTSMATPGVSGTIAQIYEWYKNVKGGGTTFPQNILVKATLLNNADDFGNAGPDYKFGYGRINALNTIRAMETNRYEENTISAGGSYTKSITVPAGATQLRVMIVWRDPAAAVSAATALVNNLNMTVTNPSSVVFNPWILAPGTPNAVATRGVDNLNNVEQVTIDNPAAGTYNITIQGTSVPFGPQAYALTWTVDEPYVRVTYPVGGEQLETGTAYTVNWDGSGIVGSQTLEFSLNNGATWTTLSTSLAANVRSFSWTTPGTISNQALIRVTNGALTDQSDAVFSLLRRPTGLTATAGCGSINLTWTAVPSATSYDVFRLNTATGNYDFLANVAGTSHNVTSLAAGSYWFAITAKHAGTGAVSMRSNAVQGTVVTSPNDIAMVAILSPGCDFATPSTQAVTIRIRSLACATIPTGTSIPVSYTRGTTVLENIVLAAPLTSGSFLNYTFTTPASFPTSGAYFIDAAVAFPGDAVASNNSISGFEVRTAASLPLYEDFENPNPAPCWTRTQNAGSDGFVYSPTNASASFTIPPHTQYASSNDDLCDCDMANDFLITPRLNFTGHTGLNLNFQAVYPNNSFGSQAFVKVSTTGIAGPWTTVHTLTGVDATWQNVNVNLSAYDGMPQVWVAFHHDDDGNWAAGFAVDDVKICSSNAPSLVSLTPTNGATGVAVGTNLVMTFDQEMQAGVGNITISDGVTPIVLPITDPQITIAGNTLTIDLVALLGFSKTYTVTISAGALRNICGVNFASTGLAWSFTTVAAPDLTPPVVVTLDPANGSVGVPPASDLSVTFSETVIASPGGSISLFTGAGVLVQTFPLAGFSGSTLVLNPTTDLLPSTVYYLVFNPGSLADLAGNAFAQILTPLEWRFTTGVPGGSIGTPSISLTPPSWIKAVGQNTTTIDLRWFDMTPNENGYRIYRSTADGYDFGLLTTVPAGSGEMNFVDVGLKPDTRYIYFVRPYVGEVYETSDEAIGFTYPNIPALVSKKDACMGASGLIEVMGDHLSGEFYWYDSETSTTAMNDVSGAAFTKNLFQTPVLTTARTFYVTAKGKGFESKPRKAITVDVLPLPVALILGSNLQYGCSNTLLLNAEAQEGANYRWILNEQEIATTTTASFTANKSGAYKVVVEKNGCTSLSNTVRVVLNYAPKSQISEGETPTFCESGVLTVKKPDDDESYEWFLGSTLAGTGTSLPVVESGTYSLVVTKNGCTGSSESKVNIVKFPDALTLTATNNTLCAGEEAELNAPSIEGASYEWYRNGRKEQTSISNILKTSKTGTYMVRVLLNGCSKNSEEISVERLIAPRTTLKDNSLTGTITVEVEGSGSAISQVSWFYNGEEQSEFADKSSIVPSKEGAYKARVTFANGCQAETNTVRFFGALAIEDDEENLNLESSLVIYPNPTKGLVYMNLDGLKGEVLVEITDALGRMVSSYSFDASKTPKAEMSIEKLPNAVYTLKIQTSKGIVYKTIAKVE
ncbi:MAG: T9SS C-terminal target domain-containing protein [Cytophagales bacterium]|nr:MAG: T9SS C-terminal target domain-containing protein [Cytophagales bacterium]TAF61705.1 MAG: T9SS C-terminal target domain-containing protein [Cytophagales bacterium]